LVKNIKLSVELVEELASLTNVDDECVDATV